MGRNRYFFVIFLLVSALFFSCELTQDEPEEGSVQLVSIALNYHGTNVNYLSGTLNDESETRLAFEALGKLSSRPFIAHSFIQKGGSETAEKSYRPLYTYDSVEEPSLPTKGHILSHLASLSTILKPEDLTIFYYSGHGYDNGSLVVAPTNPCGNIFMEDGTIASECLLSVETLLDALQVLPGVKLLILDSCYCGAFVQENGTSISMIGNPKYFEETFIQFFNSGKTEPAVFVLAATTADNTSKEPQDSMHPHGYFTEALLQGLGWDTAEGILETKIPPAGTKGKVTVDNLYAYIHDHQKIPTEGTAKYQYQHPVITGGSRDLVLFRY
jgi:hypothetical protein